MNNAVVISLREPGSIDPTEVLTGPLRRIRRTRLQPGAEEMLNADGVEFTLFVLAGSGNAATGSTDVPLHYGVSVTAPLGSVVKLTASPNGLEYFLAELAVATGGPQ